MRLTGAYHGEHARLSEVLFELAKRIGFSDERNLAPQGTLMAR